MTDAAITAHKTKHLLSHVLVAAAVQRWPEATLGESGETDTGFYADFGLDNLPDENALASLTDAMARLLRDFKTFRDLRLTPAAALLRFHGQPWKTHQIQMIAELDSRVRCYELDGFIDLCDCGIKDPRELRAVHPEKFLLTGAHSVVWSHRGRDQRFTRITGELFPAPPPCECCPPAS
jgi:threonyl-tRNA synthetase